jgi:hypothetical protein
MKGQLVKTEKGWVVRYDQRTWQDPSAEDGLLPLHPKCGIPQDAMCDVLDNGFAEVEFEMVLCSFSKNKDDYYAKLIQKHQTFIDNRKDKLETLAKCLAKSWFYGEWEWENPNERVMQMLMQDLGLYPFKDEDEMIQQTRVDEDLYKEAVDKVALRNPRIMPIAHHHVDTNEMINHIGEVNEMVCMFEPTTDTSSATICKHCGKEKFLHNHVPDVGKMVEGDVWALGLEDELNKLPYTKHLDDGQYNDGQLAGFELGATWGFKKAKETLYTEEQVREAIKKATTRKYNSHFYNADEIIQSLKQPKQ